MADYDLEFHEYAQLFPLITGEEYTALVHDIDANGQRTAIILHQGKILDGRNRYRACADLLLEPKFDAYAGEDALAYVLSLNLFRRQLTVAQRALIAAELSSLRATTPISIDLGSQAEQDPEAVTMAIEAAAKVLGISPRSVSSACKVVRDGTEELLQAVKAGVVSVSAAEQVAKLEKDAQIDLCSRGPNAIRKAAKEMREQGKGKPATSSHPGGKNLLPPPVPVDADEEEEEYLVLREAPTISEEKETSCLPGKKPAAQLLFEIAEEGMNDGREAESVAGAIMDEVENGLDLVLLAFITEVALKLRDRVKAKMYAG